MQVLTATSDPNPNASWLNSRGMWLGYLTTVVILHLVLMSIPLLSTAMAWTLTHVIHNLVRKHHRGSGAAGGIDINYRTWAWAWGRGGGGG